MGYSEIHCHLCGVSFNIARCRKPGEPELASWNYMGRVCDGPAPEELDLEECAQSGCCFVVSYPSDERDDVVEDPDYTPGEDLDDDEPFEYDSDHDSADAMSLDEEQEADEGNSMSDAGPYHDFLSRVLYPQDRFSGEPVGGFENSNTRSRIETVIPVTSDNFPDGYEPYELEHIPAPNCPRVNGYSGHVISLEEMRGCRTAQYLVHKRVAGGDWQPDGFHEDWEVSEDWFLSGVSDGIPSRDMDFPRTGFERGGVQDINADNVNYDPEYTAPNDLAMPFHPWCFDIFTRQSKVQFKRVNVSGLMKWRNAELSYDDFYSFARAREVNEGREQFWMYVPRSEYLAANPLYVPGLPPLLLAAVEEDSESRSQKDSVSSCPAESSQPLSQTSRPDPLAFLPLDIRLLIVDFLQPADVHNLHIASQAFRQLPNSVWYRFVRDEMPWLWEAWGEAEIEHTPSFWTTMSANEFQYLHERQIDYRNALDEEGLPAEEMVEYLLPPPKAKPEELKLPRETTNWHQVYTQIKRNWAQLRGLRNRKRIWEDVEEVIRRIRKYEGL
ncbi:uncharacterized protein BJX67DRAFT_352248 [Aspergillus lucknowensis]|uniref:F-box domain-containing protein n=1 Tax=Aspergillus lucknowensis TaxID=176173 RepID=A0ABR4LWL7_9EURO